jgi:hypothetical protein
MTADELYGLPLARFVAERGALARALRGERRREEAAAVAALRKPSVAAWAVNQLVRTQAEATAELFAAGDGLRAAQAALLAGGGDAGALRAARDRERAAVDRLREAAAGLLDADGHELSPAVLDRVADTLHAAALDDDAGEQVRRGCLVRELQHAGLGDGGGFEVAAAVPGSATPARPARRPAPPAPGEPPAAGVKAEPRAVSSRRPETGGRKGDQAASREAERRAREREAERRAREREAAAVARAEESAARRRAERAERAVSLAEERHQRAADALDEAARGLAEARAQSQAAAEAYRRARVEAGRGVEPG